MFTIARIWLCNSFSKNGQFCNKEDIESSTSTFEGLNNKINRSLGKKEKAGFHIDSSKANITKAFRTYSISSK